MMVMPMIIETVGRNKKTFDIPTKLYEQNIVTLFGEINNETSYSVVTQLLYLDSVNTKEPINLYINSNGGSVYDGLAIHDTIRNMKRKVNTVCVGFAASMGAFLLFSGTGTRKSLPNSRIMIHSVSSGTSGTVHDQIIDLEETKFLQTQMMEIQASYSGGKCTLEQMTDFTMRDKYLSAKETKELGLIDEIVEKV